MLLKVSVYIKSVQIVHCVYYVLHKYPFSFYFCCLLSPSFVLQCFFMKVPVIYHIFVLFLHVLLSYFRREVVFFLSPNQPSLEIRMHVKICELPTYWIYGGKEPDIFLVLIKFKPTSLQMRVLVRIM
jgi:hypothetical protein